ncbi:MAG: DNA polymerase beta superfamily protein [Akkermansiaceae bacterium]
MKEEINELLDRIEVEYGVEVLYACESGSRAWGFASPDSDYDIRFIYRYTEHEYLKVQAPKETIEIAIKDDLDPGGWDVRKALGLLKKSNGALSEWLHSPIVYREKDGFLADWRATYGEVFAGRGLYDHYRGLAKQMWKGALAGDEVRAKSYLYCLRSSLAVLYVEDRNEPAPVEFAELLDYLPESLHSVVDELLVYKSASGEKEKMPRISALDEFLEKEVNRDFPDTLMHVSDVKGRDAAVDDLLLRSLQSGKNLPLMRKSEFTLDRIRRPDLLLFEAVGGSQAYGTNTPESDEDLRGLFAAPTSFLTAAESIEQVQDEKGDEVYYELGRFVELLMKSNPNALELLFIPDDCVRYRHPVMDKIDPQMFLTKKCEMNFAGYALAQVRKARGLNKKIVNPEPEERLELRDFCYVMAGQGAVKLGDWLKIHGLVETELGATAVNHAANTYSLFRGPHYRGLFSRSGEPSILCSSVRKEEEALGWMVCNIDGFKKHCKQHKEYWNWVKNRNENRYLVNSEHGRGYDSKNMMHTLRLLEIAEMIAKEGTIQLRSPNVDFLMKVRNGEFQYEELLTMAEDKMADISKSYETCKLPEDVDFTKANELLAEMRFALED